MLGKAVAFYRQSRARKDPQYRPARLAQALEDYGAVKVYRTELKLGREALEEALQIASDANLQGAELGFLASIKTNLGALLVIMGEFDKAGPLLRQSLTEFRSVSRQPRWEMGVTQLFLGLVAMHENNLDEAERYMLESEQIYRSTIGDSNGYMGSNLDQQATLLLRKGDLQRAEEKQLAGLGIRRSLSRPSRFWITPLTTLREISRSSGDSRMQRGHFAKPWTSSISSPRKASTRSWALEIRLARVLIAQNRREEARRLAREAESLAREAESLAREHLGAQHPSFAAIAECLSATAEPAPE